METKKWYTSKTFWGNLIAAAGIVLSQQFGFELTAEEGAAILVLINLLLRAITKQPLSM